ncbi:MAG TPA: hypothetical protein DCE41_33280, partial [Cytophagales bacterium]|nr:hypothetical protein [Cytophagales bacterium]
MSNTPPPEALPKLKAFIERIIPLSDSAWAFFSSELQYRTYPKGSFFVSQGEVNEAFGFATTGLFRFYYLVDGQEHVRQFFFANQFIGDFQSYLTRQPSQLYIEAMHDSAVLLLPYAHMQEGYRKFPEFERFSRI